MSQGTAQGGADATGSLTNFVVRACACPSPPATYGERAKTAIAFAFNADFARVLQAQMVSRETVAEGWVAAPVTRKLGPAVAWLAAAPSRKGGRVMIERSGCAVMLNAC